MTLIRQTIPNLVGGVSQQPDAMRLEGQCTEQINGYSDPVNGLRKRPRTDFVRKHDITVTDDDACHFITRNNEEKYVAVTASDKLRIFNLTDGTEASINGNANGLTIGSSDYLYEEDSKYRENFKFLSVGDTTYVVNKSVDVARNTTLTPSVSDTALIFIKQGAVSTDYNLKITHNQQTAPTTAQLTVSTEIYTNVNPRRRRGRISGVSITNAGTGYLDGTRTVYWTPAGGYTVYYAAEISVTITNGSVTSASVVNKGSFSQGIVNTTNKTFSMSSPDDPNFNGQTIDITFASGSGSDDGNTTDIAEELHTQLVGDANIFNGNGSGSVGSQLFTATLTDNLIELVPNTANVTNLQYSITSSDGLADNGMQVIYKEVNTISDLPLFCKNNFKTKILGGDDTSDDYYVKFVTKDAATIGNGHWEETFGFEQDTGIDADSFVHQLVLTAENEFEFDPLTLADRLVGDDETNPLPSFAGEVISNVVFFRNRLGILSADKIVFSESGLGTKDTGGSIEYNFMRTTVQTLLDSDPIDITVATDKITNLKSAVPFQDNLILFSENTQFSVNSGTSVFSPNSVRITPLTEYDASPNINPAVVGDSVYFVTDKDTSLEVREYIINKTSESYESFSITTNIPTYIPTGVRDFSYSTTENCVVLTSGTDLKSLYVYKFVTTAGKKIQSAWSKFTFPFDIHGVNFEQDILNIVFKYDGSSDDCLMYCTMDFDQTSSEPSTVQGTFDYKTLVDFAFQATMDGSGGDTTVQIPFPTGHLSLASDGSDWDISDEDYSSLTTYSSSNNTLVITHITNSSVTVTVGLKYTMEYTFSEFVIKQKQDNFQTAVNLSHRLKNISVYYTNTKGDDNQAKFELVMTSPRTLQVADTSLGKTATTVFGTETYQLFDPVDGFFTVPLFISAEDVTVKLSQPYKYPANFQNVNIESIVRDRARPY